MNKYIRDLSRRVDARFSEDSTSMSMTEWIEKNTTLNGRPFTTRDYDFQRAIVDDMHSNMDVKKCSQIGLTEVQIRKALAFLMRYRGTALIFTLPNEKLYEKISKSRIRPIVDKDRVFNPPVNYKPTRTKEMLQFGDSWLYVTGCTEADATSTSADAVFNDEVDISPQDMLALFNSRLQNSEWKLSQRFSTPTFPLFGIDMGFQNSDQHLYLIHCESCNTWQWPQFTREFVHIPGLPDHIEELTEIDQSIIDEIDVLAATTVCKKCRRPLDIGNPDLHEWVPKYPGRTHARGYHVTPFSTRRLPPSYIIGQLLKYKERDYLRGFFNTVLGEAYSDGNIQVPIEVIQSCMEPNSLVPEIRRDEYVWIGIDMGQTVHVVLGRGSSVHDMRPFMFKALHIDNLKGFVEEVLETYNVIGGSVDRHPYTPTAKELFEMSDGRIVPVEYRGTKEVKLVFDEAKELTHAQADRTELIDEVVRQLKRRNLMMSGYGHYKQIIIDHIRGMVRKEEPDSPATWIKITEQDHFFHALGFLLVATKIKEVERIHRKDDPRTFTSASVVNMKDTHTGLLGFRRKTFDNPLLRQ